VYLGRRLRILLKKKLVEHFKLTHRPRNGHYPIDLHDFLLFFLKKNISFLLVKLTHCPRNRHYPIDLRDFFIFY